MNIIECFTQYWTKEGCTEAAPVEKWQPFIKILIDKAKENMAKGKNVAIGYAVYKSCIRDYARSICPEIKFIHVDVPVDTIAERNIVRTKRIMADQGMTMEQTWALEHMAEARKKFGEEYSEAAFKTYMKEQACCGFEGLY